MQQSDHINVLRFLSADAVQKANSGHPGMPMGMAEIATALWSKHLRHNPKNPTWFNRDRFVLSNGHGSMLLYSLLHLTGYDLSINDIKDFRKLKSKTPGHPEYDIDIGIETTTGPLGQGIANAVGMAVAEKILAAEFNKDDIKPIDHFTYVFLGDGCLMEGISHEACSFAGTHNLGKLICFYDQNGISIDGEIEHWFTDDSVKRFESYGWQTICVDGHDIEDIDGAIHKAKEEVMALEAVSRPKFSVGSLVGTVFDSEDVAKITKIEGNSYTLLFEDGFEMLGITADQLVELSS